jgi:hypothetical protein
MATPATIAGSVPVRTARTVTVYQRHQAAGGGVAGGVHYACCAIDGTAWAAGVGRVDRDSNDWRFQRTIAYYPTLDVVQAASARLKRIFPVQIGTDR